MGAPNWFTNAVVLLNPKISEKQILSQKSLTTEVRQVYNLYFEAREKNIFFFSKDKHLQSKFALENKLCNKIIYLNY